LAFADAGKRVLVLDADLRRPGLAGLFGLERAVGLTDVLTGRTPLAKALQRWEDLLVLPSGPIPTNPSELLGSPEMSRLIDDARQLCDLVLIDSPPVLSTADATVLAARTDGVLVVVRYGSTTTGQVHAAREALDIVGARVLGAVLNRMAVSALTRYANRGSRPDLSPEVEPSFPTGPRGAEPPGTAPPRAASTRAADASESDGADQNRAATRRSRPPARTKKS
jgi:capsular exopolysaccharide synthesis family protein